MKSIFNLDSPIMVFFANLADVVFLNILCIICCIPIITIGPSITAMHYVTLKMARKEEIYVAKHFFKAFKENFKQSFLVWLGFLIISVVFFIDYRIIKIMDNENIKVLSVIIGIIYVFVCFTVMYTFPLMARFENPLKQTLKNGFFMCIIHFFKTIMMAVIYVAPVILITMFNNLIPYFLVVGFSGPAYINSFIWKSIFKRYEPVKVEDEIINDIDFQIPEE